MCTIREKDPLKLTVGGLSAADKAYFATTSRLPGDVFLVPEDRFKKVLEGPTYFRKADHDVDDLTRLMQRVDAIAAFPTGVPNVSIGLRFYASTSRGVGTAGFAGLRVRL